MSGQDLVCVLVADRHGRVEEPRRVVHECAKSCRLAFALVALKHGYVINFAPGAIDSGNGADEPPPTDEPVIVGVGCAKVVGYPMRQARRAIPNE